MPNVAEPAGWVANIGVGALIAIERESAVTRDRGSCFGGGGFWRGVVRNDLRGVFDLIDLEPFAMLVLVAASATSSEHVFQSERRMAAVGASSKPRGGSAIDSEGRPSCGLGGCTHHDSMSKAQGLFDFVVDASDSLACSSTRCPACVPAAIVASMVKSRCGARGGSGPGSYSRA